MKEDAKDTLNTIVLIVVTLGMCFAAFAFLAVETNRKENACTDKGGTYLPREGVCLDMKQIPID